MLEETEEDDTHLCIRCNARIIGLENYVEHRSSKSLCSTSKLINKPTTSKGPASAAPSRAEEDETIETEEPRRKAVKTSSPLPITNNKDPSKSKTPTGGGFEGGKASQESPERRSGAPPSENFLDKSMDFNLDYELIDDVPSSSVGVTRTEGGYDYEGADLFFSSLQLQSSSKRDSLGTSKRGASSPDRRKRGGKLSSISTPHYELDEGSSEDETEEEFDLQDLDYDSEMDEMEEEENFRAPPRTHTGGKWKPEDVPRSSATAAAAQPTRSTSGQSSHFLWVGGKPSSNASEDFVVLNSPPHDEDYRSYMSPPQDYARGKWVPGRTEMEMRRGGAGNTSISRRSSESPIREQINAADSKTITAGGGGGGEGGDAPVKRPIWCAVCNRTLASEVSYQHHLASNVHRKHARMEWELEQAMAIPASSSAPAAGAFDASLQDAEEAMEEDEVEIIFEKTPSRGPVTQISSIRVIKSKRSREQSAPFLKQSQASAPDEDSGPAKRRRANEYSPPKRSNRIRTQTLEIESMSDDEKKGAASHYTIEMKPKNNVLKSPPKLRRKTFTECNVCRTRLPIAMMGRHLLSHMHYRRMNLHRHLHQQLVLDYIDQIVLLSPFQCQVCRFYANTQELFMVHWRSQEHGEAMQSREVKRLWCSFCKYQCPPDDMDEHLMSEGHEEVIQALNRTHRIIIREKMILKCLTCRQEFNTNLEIKRHRCREEIIEDAEDEQEQVIDTASDKYQSLFKCEDCSKVFRKMGLLIRHRIGSHAKSEEYHCHKCDLTFPTNDLAKKHRTSLEHKLKAGKLMGKNLERVCRLCNVTFKDVLAFREHNLTRHTVNTESYSCVICGAQFDVPQKLSHHVRLRLCSKQVLQEPQDEIIAAEGKHCCGSCAYKTESKAELLLHVAIVHENPHLTYKSKTRIKCPLCVKEFKKGSLLAHLRRHTDERIFGCSKCPSSFTRKSNMEDHMAKCKGLESLTMKSRASVLKTKGGTFGHIKCHHAGCKYQTTANHKLKKHLRVHGEKKLACDLCSFKTKELRYLHKHNLVHTKERPYQCSECPMAFSCNSNLRVHFLTIHHGSVMYQCESCGYGTNYHNDLKKHVCTEQVEKGSK